MNPLDKLSEEMDHLVSSLSSQPVVGDLNAGVTQYSFFLAIGVILLLILIFAFKNAQQKQGIAPKGFFVNGMEYLVEFVRDDLCKALIGDEWRVHFPFIASVFFFILINNIVGVIPGCKPGTGTIGVTAAVALVSFCYFIYWGVKKHGVFGYIKSLAPQGVVFPMNALVWVIEVFSTFLRLVTLAVRLFCNLFAGHVVMGTFAILTSLFMEPLLQAVSAQSALTAGASVFWIILLIVIYAVELLVAAIQAYVFTLLSAVYVQLAVADEH
ncbi:MAG: F0F1 ATP synthase subunit A [Atopobiaceae bacterium]|nr:F0F1 ATP synthase subunit A [Atopobiaceae bacterium]